MHEHFVWPEVILAEFLYPVRFPFDLTKPNLSA